MCGMTYHARVEREERINYIIDTIGVGEPVAKFQRENDKRYMTLTNTGVIIITGSDNIIITMFIGSIDEAIKTYRSATNRRDMPDGLYRKIKSVQKYRRNQP